MDSCLGVLFWFKFEFGLVYDWSFSLCRCYVWFELNDGFMFKFGFDFCLCFNLGLRMGLVLDIKV